MYYIYSIIYQQEISVSSAELSFSREVPFNLCITNIRIEYGGLTYY